MFQRLVSGRMVRRFGSVMLVGGLLLALAAPTSAKSLIGGGVMRAEVVCSMSTRTADVSVIVQMPDGYPNGLYLYTQIWARARGTAAWTFISQAPSGLLYTWGRTSSWGALMRNSYTILTGSFTGSGYQEILVRWQYAVPGGYWSGWNSQQSFTVPGDPDSSIYQKGSYLGGYTTTCSL